MDQPAGQATDVGDEDPGDGAFDGGFEVLGEPASSGGVMHVTLFENSATMAAWVGAIGQTLTACLAAYIAFLTHRHARRSAQATSLKMAYEMVNEFNKIVLYNPQHAKDIIALRKPIQSPSKDAIVFMYLNFIDTTVSMGKAELVSQEEMQATLKNGAHWLASLDHDTLLLYLERGYTTSFKELVLDVYEGARREAVAVRR